MEKLKNIKYVVAVLLDALCYKEVENGSLCPTIKRLSDEGISCTHAFSIFPTQFAAPLIHSSSAALDYGGYDKGIKHRPISWSEIFSENGFKTAFFTTVHTADFLFGYERGFSEVYSLYDINFFWKPLHKIYLKYYKNLYHRDFIGKAEYVREMSGLLEEAFVFIKGFCEIKDCEKKKGALTWDYQVFRHDFAAIAKLVENELEQLRRDKEYYIFENAVRIDSRSLYEFLGLKETNKKKIIHNLLYKVYMMFFQNFMFQIRSINGLMDGNYILTDFKKWLTKNKGEKFFAYTHILDIHEGNLSQAIFQKAPGAWPFERNKVKKDKLFYHSSIKYVDEMIKSLIAHLKTEGMLDQTLLVLFSDHGTSAGGPVRNLARKELKWFYEEFIRVPMIFWSPQITSQVNRGLCTTMDVAPTVLDLLGCDVPPIFQGSPVYSPSIKEREYIQFEDVGRGPCDVQRKPFNVMIRGMNFKFIYRENVNSETGVLTEYFNLLKDPHEMNNIAYTKGCADSVVIFEKMARARIDELRQGKPPITLVG